MKVTIQTVTDAQIRELRDDPRSSQLVQFNNRDMSVSEIAKRALRFYGPDRRLARYAARLRCVAILNAQDQP